GQIYGTYDALLDNKDDLVATVVGEKLVRQAKEYAELLPGRAGLEAFVYWYLSRNHRAHPEAGCPSAALLDEIARSDKEAKRAYTKGAKTILDEICVRLAPE